MIWNLQSPVKDSITLNPPNDSVRYMEPVRIPSQRHWSVPIDYALLHSLNTQLRLPVQFSSVQSLSRVQLFVTPWTVAHQASLVHHQLPEFTQTHVHWVGDAIQPSHPLSSPSPPALNLSQHHGLFKWVSSSHQVPKVLVFQLQYQSFQWTLRTDCL